MYIKNKKIISGFTLIEALVAISLLMIAISSPIMLAQKGLSSSILSRDQMIASFLAQDGIEAVKNIRDEIAINQKVYSITFDMQTNGNSVCDGQEGKVCVKVSSGDSEIYSCDDSLESGVAWCTEGEVDWLGGKLKDCICNLEEDFCDFDNVSNIYCNIDSSDTNKIFNNSDDIYVSLSTEDLLFQKYSIEGNLEQKTKFNRKINIKKSVDNENEAEIKVRVYWDSQYGIQKVEIKTFMYNFEPILIKP